MKRKRIIVAFGAIAACALFLATPVGIGVLDLVRFIFVADRYLREEAEIEKRIVSMSDAEFRQLMERVAALAAEAEPRPERVDLLDPAGAPIPASLEYLSPKRVWISQSGATIELLHMMDADSTLFVERTNDGTWSISGHFGDFMNPRRLLWTEKRPNQALQPTPMPVTPRADARVAPSTGVADL